MYSAHRVRAKTRAAVKRREDIVEHEEMESGELNLIPYLDIVTNLMLFLLASVSAGLILVPDRHDAARQGAAAADQRHAARDQPRRSAAQAVRLDQARRDDPVVGQRPRGHARAPKAVVPRTGKDGDAVRRPLHVRDRTCATARSSAASPSNVEPAPVFDYRALNKALIEIADAPLRRQAAQGRHLSDHPAGRRRDPVRDDGRDHGRDALRCSPSSARSPRRARCRPTDENLKKAKEPISPDGKLYDTARASYDPKKMALFSRDRVLVGVRMSFHATRGARASSARPSGASPRARRSVTSTSCR